ncbi:MAG: hypothetical protein HY671_05685 [Chloroflexi bacterium]|nr:hypothetical protein [Chloroflexota bacterium]
MDRIVDQAWTLLLANVTNKRCILRPSMGSEIDLYVPQSRLLYLAESNPAMPRLLYLASQSAAQRNAYVIVRRLSMPADYFWKFEFWPKERAFATLDKIMTRVFSAIMSQAKQGTMKIEGVAVDPLRITVSFRDCVECAGITGLKNGICYYHAGTFSGIMSALINRDLDAFETACCAGGDGSCTFVIGDKNDQYVKTSHDAYVSPHKIGADLVARLEKSLSNAPVRALGNMVDINYLRLVVASTLLANPQLFASTSFDVGSQLGRKLAPVLTKFYGHDGLENIAAYYQQLHELNVEIKEQKPNLGLVISESPECSRNNAGMEMMSFLLGELQGLASGLTKTELTLRESRFEDDNLVVTFEPKV